MAKCGECNYLNGAHTAWCSQSPRNRNSPPPARKPGYQEEKRNFKKRDDDGRSKKR